MLNVIVLNHSCSHCCSQHARCCRKAVPEISLSLWTLLLPPPELHANSYICLPDFMFYCRFEYLLVLGQLCDAKCRHFLMSFQSKAVVKFTLSRHLPSWSWRQNHLRGSDSHGVVGTLAYRSRCSRRRFAARKFEASTRRRVCSEGGTNNCVAAAGSLWPLPCSRRRRFLWLAVAYRGELIPCRKIYCSRVKQFRPFYVVDDVAAVNVTGVDLADSQHGPDVVVVNV